LTTHKLLFTCDHFPILYIKHKQVTQPKETKFKLKRTINKTTRDKFKQEILTTDWTRVNQETDAQKSYSAFHRIISTLFEKKFPLKKHKLGYTNKLPWITLGIKHSICNKQRLYKRYLKHPNPFNKIQNVQKQIKSYIEEYRM
jgi:hypothetical protein